MECSRVQNISERPFKYVRDVSGAIILFYGHSIKRSSIQLYHSLEIRDKFREITKMSVLNAYSAYFADLNNFLPPALSRFNNIKYFMKHASTL